MRCAQCEAEIDEHATHCAACAAVAATPEAPPAEKAPAYLVDEITRFLDAGLYVEAADACGRALAACPDDAVVHTLQGDSLRGKGQYSEAMEAYRRAVQLAPDEENRRKYDEMIDIVHGIIPASVIQGSPPIPAPAAPAKADPAPCPVPAIAAEPPKLASTSLIPSVTIPAPVTERPPLDEYAGALVTPARAKVIVVAAVVVVLAVLFSLQPWRPKAAPARRGTPLPVDVSGPSHEAPPAPGLAGFTPVRK